jgi:hypothetical protein
MFSREVDARELTESGKGGSVVGTGGSDFVWETA